MRTTIKFVLKTKTSFIKKTLIINFDKNQDYAEEKPKARRILQCYHSRFGRSFVRRSFDFDDLLFSH